MLVRASLQNDSTRVFSQHLHIHRTRHVAVTFLRRTYLCCRFTLRRVVTEIGTTLPLFPLSNYTRARAALPVLGNYTTAPGFSECQDDNPRSQMIIRHVQLYNDSRFPRKYPPFILRSYLRREFVVVGYTLMRGTPTQSTFFRVG